MAGSNCDYLSWSFSLKIPVTAHPKPSENPDFRVTHRDFVTETYADKPVTERLQIGRDGQGMTEIEI
jgi:hypothetical protein